MDSGGLAHHFSHCWMRMEMVYWPGVIAMITIQTTSLNDQDCDEIPTIMIATTTTQLMQALAETAIKMVLPVLMIAMIQILLLSFPF